MQNEVLEEETKNNNESQNSQNSQDNLSEATGGRTVEDSNYDNESAGNSRNFAEFEETEKSVNSEKNKIFGIFGNFFSAKKVSDGAENEDDENNKNDKKKRGKAGGGKGIKNKKNSKLGKILSIVLLLPAVACLCLLIFLKNSINTTKVRKDINSLLASKIKEFREHQLFKEMDMRFVIQSPISISVLPTLKMVFKNVRMDNMQYRDNLFSIGLQRIETKLDFGDFLRKKITVKNIAVSGMEITMESNKLADFYLKKEIVKRKVKLEDNEVYGVKNKLRDILSGTNEEVEAGYKVVETPEEVRIDLDNELVQQMLVELIKTLKTANLNVNAKTNINISGANFSSAKNGVIEKEIKNISLTMSGDKTKKITINFNMNNMPGELRITLNKNNENEKLSLNMRMTNGLEDDVDLKYEGENPFLVKNFEELTAKLTLDAKLKNFNDFSQWILPTTSKYYYLIDYRKNIRVQTQLSKNGEFYEVESFSLDGSGVDVNGSFSLAENKNSFIFNVKKLDLDNLVLNLGKTELNTDPNSINIFKKQQLEDLLELIRNDEEHKNINSSIKITIEELVKNGKSLKNSEFDFDMIGGDYRINSFRANYDDLEIRVDGQQEVNGIFMNDMEIAGDNFASALAFLNLPDYLNIKNFNLKTKFIIHGSRLYLVNYSVGEEGNEVTGSLEYTFGGKNHIACSMKINNMVMEKVRKKTSTLKEQLLWLNGFTKNVFLDLTVNDLKYNDMEHINFRACLNFLPGYLHIYRLENLNLEKISGVGGRILLDIRKNNPFIGLDLKIARAEKDMDLYNYVFDMEKYKNILLRTPIDEKNQANYWINLLFSLPLFDQIDGNINLTVDQFVVNKLPIEALKLSATIGSGLININNIEFNGLGGSTILKGTVDLTHTKSINLTLTDTIYRVSDVAKLLLNGDKISGLDGTIGIGGILRGVGINSGVFKSSLVVESKFIGKNLFIKQIGLDELRTKLMEIYHNQQMLETINVQQILKNDSGTRFSEFSGLFRTNAGISSLAMEGKGNGISTKMELRMDSTKKDTSINMVNTSLLVLKVGDSNIPLYLTASFNEDFSKGANLLFNTSQIDEYVKKVRDAFKNNKDPLFYLR